MDSAIDDDAFEAAAAFLAASVTARDSRFDDKLKLRFYGLYKQGTVGKCNVGKPGFLDFAGRAKWDAWQQLGDLPMADARQTYCDLLSQVAPGWDEDAAGGKAAKGGRGGGMGPVFSCLAAGEEAATAEEQAGPRTLHELAGQGDVEGVRALLAAGAEVDARDEAGCSALHFAADRGSAAAAEALLGAGADVGAVDDEGQTPLHYAAITEQREVYDLLVARGADPSAPDSSGTTPAQAAPAAWGVGGSTG